MDVLKHRAELFRLGREVRNRLKCLVAEIADEMNGKAHRE